ncbi:DUF262 domain-containing protein [Methylobacterium sp. PvR107]|uniref:GmrSD restriction endonuclease domain-containing protein n=1 Tax=Methylobacterium sp. PvR107 TaxID=2806597 RepID=UPI001AE4BF5A|nr:DUF262 domain-containing protein [Methylobacterium sp. PvR107]MBP1180936.1 hypothetical protein [Methylobacterium sp. PvR107]
MSSIFALVNDIETGEIVLPAIQRNFVWDTSRIEKLFDSLMRGYPVGIVLLWETYERIQYRNFTRNHRNDEQYIYAENDDRKRLRYVLDGQQRLTSINIALNGSFQGKTFFFDLLSGSSNDDTSEEKYSFKFADQKDVDAENSAISAAIQPDGSPCYWYSLPKLLKMTPIETMKLKSEIQQLDLLSDDAKLKLEENLFQIKYVFTENSECLKTQIIDASLPADYKGRKTIFDILEIFVRINSQGVRLSRSDLIISMLRLYWPEISTLLPEFLAEINAGSDLKIDNDFVIRCLFSTSGIGTRLDFDLLRKKSNVDAIRGCYNGCLNAIRQTVDFVRISCQIDSSRLIGGLNTLIPFVHFAFLNKADVFSTDGSAARKALYIFAFSKVFTQHSDSRTGAFIRDFVNEGSVVFPVEGAAQFVNWKTGFNAIDSSLISYNVELALSILQQRSGGKVYFSKNLPEIDHIFPRSKMEERYDSALVNDIGNLWILQQVANRNKSAKDPREFLSAVDKKLLKNALIDIDSLDQRRFRSFVSERREKIFEIVSRITELDDPALSAALSGEAGEDEI